VPTTSRSLTPKPSSPLENPTSLDRKTRGYSKTQDTGGMMLADLVAGAITPSSPAYMPLPTVDRPV